MEFHRTGQAFKHRKCPKHQSRLELCINDTDYSKWSQAHQPLYGNHDNRVAWHCELCLGYWFENHFIDQAEWNRPYRIEIAHLVLRCPSCTSNRVTHTCVPECCGQHKCLDCDTIYESQTKLIQKGTIPDGTKEPVGSPRLRGQGWTSSGPLEPGHMHRTGILRDYRQCEHDDHSLLELVLIDSIGRCDAQVGWYCEECKRVAYEVGGQRSKRIGFQAEVEAMALCPQCNSQYLDSIDSDPSHCHCVECGAKVEVTLVDPDS
jgi:hypothetical protein